MDDSRQYEEGLSWNEELQQEEEKSELRQLLDLVDPIARCGTVYTEQDAKWNETFLAALSLTTKYWH